MTASSLSIPLEEIPVRLRCSMCNNLAQDAYRLPCCEQSICGNCQSKLPTVCKICDHSPLDAAECKVYASLRTTVTIFLRTAEKKYGSLAKAKKEATPTPHTPIEKPADPPVIPVVPESTREASLPVQADQGSSAEAAEDKDASKLGEQNGASAAENGHDETESTTQNQNAQGTSDGMNSQIQGGQFWNSQQGMNQYPDQSGQYQGYNMGWNGYDQSSGYGMQGGWGNGMQNMMDQSGAMNSFNGMQSFPDGFNGMGNTNTGYGYGQGSYGNTGMGIQGQGNWGNGWNMQNGLDGSSFNSSGMNAGFYPGAGGYNHQSYGNHQSQQNQMMPHQQFQSRGYHHNQYRNYSNQNMRGNYGQQQQQFGVGGPPRGNNRNYEQQASGNDVSGAPHSVNGDGPEQNAAAADGEPPQINSRARGDTEKVLVDEVSNEQVVDKDFQGSMSSETNGATNAISSIDIRGDSQTTESTDSSGTVVKENPYQTPAGDVEPQPQAPVNAPTGPRAMRERSERGRGRGRGGFYGGRGGFHQTQVAGSDDASVSHLRTGSITSSGKNGAAAGPDSDYDDASKRQSKTDDAQFSPVESRKDHESHDRDRRRSRSRSRSRTRKHRHHRSRSRKRSSSPRQSRAASGDRTRSRSRDRKRHRDGDRDKDRDREKDKRDKESGRSHRSHKSSHRHRRDHSRSRSRDRKDTKERDEATGDIDAKDTEKIPDVESKSRHRDRDNDRRKDKDGSKDDRRRDGDKKSRKRSRSRHRSHGHHKRSRGDDEERSDRHGDDPERKSKSSRSSRRHSTRYEDEETAAERERRVEREREEERWGKR